MSDRERLNTPACALTAGHTGDHAPAVDWNAVTLTTDSPEIRCAWPSEIDALQSCRLVRGHEGLHSYAPRTHGAGCVGTCSGGGPCVNDPTAERA
jgi:hypothetical protein